VKDRLIEFPEFFEAEVRRLTKAMYLLTGNRTDAEDLAQDAFVRVYERWARVRAMDSPAGYLYTVAFNLWRRKHRRRLFPSSPEPVPEVDPALTVEARSEATRLLLSLSSEQRQAVVLVEWLGLSAEEAAAVLRGRERAQLHRWRRTPSAPEHVVE
jgi:RNA polymerase sigma-70 factor (ECF subfamily)